MHGYGGLVFHDVINLRHARKAIEQGVDGIICVCAGAGGHAGALSPFALVKEVREIFDGTIILSGSMSRGNDALAAQVCGHAYRGQIHHPVRMTRVQRQAVVLGMDGDGLDAKVGGRPGDANGNFATIGDE